MVGGPLTVELYREEAETPDESHELLFDLCLLPRTVPQAHDAHNPVVVLFAGGYVCGVLTSNESPFSVNVHTRVGPPMAQVPVMGQSAQ